jgi:hypothetical protein
MPAEQQQQMFDNLTPILEYNYNHYSEIAKKYNKDN